MCRPLKSYYVEGMGSQKKVLDTLRDQLRDLEAIAADTDFSDAAQSEQFSRNVISVKSYYERLESLIRSGTA